MNALVPSETLIQTFQNLQEIRNECCDLIKKQPPEVFYERAVPKNFSIFTGKHQCWSLFLIRFLKRDPSHVLFPEICKMFKNTYFEEHLCTAASVNCHMILPTISNL